MAKIYATVEVICEVEGDDCWDYDSCQAEIHYLLNLNTDELKMPHVQFKLGPIEIDETRTVYDPVEPPESEEEVRGDTWGRKL